MNELKIFSCDKCVLYDSEIIPDSLMKWKCMADEMGIGVEEEKRPVGWYLSKSA